VLLQELVALAKECELPSDTRIRMEAVFAGSPEIASGAPRKASDRRPQAPTETSVGTPDGEPVAGSGATAEASGATETPGRGVLSLVLLIVLFTVLAGGAGFGVVWKIRAAGAARRQVAEDQLARLRRMTDPSLVPDETDVAIAKREALAPIEAAGYADLTLEARKLVEELETRRDVHAREVAEKKATERLAPLKERLAKAREAASGEPSEQAAVDLDALASKLDELARALPSTTAGREASDLAPTVAGEAKQAREALETRRRREAESESAYARRRESIERLAQSARYRDARASAGEFEKEWHELPSTRERVQALLALVDASARADLEDHLQRARAFKDNGAYDDARLVLKKLEPEVEGSMASEIATELASIAAREKSRSDDEEKRAASGDKARVAAALSDIADTVAARGYGEAIARLDASRRLLATAAARETLDRRARRLRAAQDALDRIADRVKRHGAQAGIDLTFVLGAGIAPRPAVGADATGLFFQLSREEKRHIAFADLKPTDLHAWVLRTVEKPADVVPARLAAAALSVELGRRSAARADLDVADGALPKQAGGPQKLSRELREDAEGDDQADKPDPPRKEDDD
jgi:hypothetical protein